MDLALDLLEGIEERRPMSEHAAGQGAEDALLVDAPPAGVTRDGIERHDEKMIDLWRSELGLPTAGKSPFWQRIARALS